MNVAFVTLEYPPDTIGGAGISSELIVSGLRTQGIDVDVFAITQNPETSDRPDDGVKFLRSRGPASVPKIFRENWTCLTELNQLSNYDVVHVYNVRQLPAVVLRSSAPVVSTMNNLTWSCVDPIEYLRSGCPTYTLAESIREAIKSSKPNYISLPKLALERGMKSHIMQTDAFTVQTNGMKNVLSKCGYPGAKISVVPNILDCRFSVESTNENMILFVGRLSREKGGVEAINAFVGLDESVSDFWSFEVYGNGPEKDEMQRIAEANPGYDINFGYTPYAELPSVYSQASVMIHGAKWPEPFSRTWLEAMASSTAIVSSENPSSIEVLDGIASFYDPFDEESLAIALSETLQSETERSEMQKRGRQRVNEYTKEKVIPKYIDIYRSVAN